LSYIGQRPVVGRYIKLDQISSGFNGSNTGFSMTAGSQAVFPGTARNLLLSLGGVIQEPDTDFTISGSTLTFTTAPVANTTFFGVIYGDMQSTGTPSDGTVLPASIASSGHFKIPQLTVNEDGADVDFRVEGDTDANLLFVDASTDRIGIGTNSPTSPLEISNATNPVIKVTSTSSSVGAGFFAQGGSSNDSQLGLNSGTTAKYTFLRDGSQSDDLRIYDSANALDIIRYRHGSYLHFGVNGSERMRIDSSGRVLIGTTAARVESNGFAAPLQVEGTGTATSSVIIARNSNNASSSNLIFQKSRGTSTGSNTVIQNNDAVGTIIFEGSDGTNTDSLASIIGACDGTPGTNDVPGRLVFSTTADGAASPTERMRINSSGQLLVGTTTNPVSNKCSLRVAYLGNTSSGNVIELTQQTNGADKAGAAIGLALGNGGESTNAADLNFKTAISGSLNTRMTIKDSGNVGIGTTSPSANLHLKDGSGNTEIKIQGGASTANDVIAFLNSAGSTRGNITYDTDNDFVLFNVNTSERMRIDSSGRLLIGTATARAVGGESNPRLHVEGTGATSNSWVNLTRFAASNGSANIQFAKSRSDTAGTYTVVQNGDNLGQISFLGADGTDMANYAAIIKAQVDGTPGSNDMPGRLLFMTTADGGTFPTERMRIDSSGNVGIGTTSPSCKLQVDAGSGGAGTVTHLELNHGGNDTNDAVKLNFARAGSDIGSIVLEKVASNNTTDFIFNTRASNTVSEAMRITGAGNLFHGRTSAITSNSVNTSNNIEQIDSFTWTLGLHADQAHKIGMTILYSSTNNNHDFIRCQVSGSGGRFVVEGDGDTFNQNGSYGQISDISLKENIVDANSQWSDIKNLKVRNFNFKESTGRPVHTQIGLVAQELETVCPKLVKESEEGLKFVSHSVLYMKAVKALQEAMTRIETLETEVAALKAA